jgi:hypothetical protein
MTGRRAVVLGAGILGLLLAMISRPATALFTGGVFVAIGSVFGDLTPEIVTGAGPGGGPHVRVFSGNVPSTVNFFAYHPAFTGGVRVAACDMDDDGRDEIITAPGPGGGPHVRVWKVTLGLEVVELFGFFAYDPAFTGGVWVACADLDGAPGDRAEIVTGAGEGGGPHVRIWKVTGNGPFTPTVPFEFFAYVPSFTGGVRVAAFDGFAGPQIVTAPGPGTVNFVATRQVTLTGGVITGATVLKAFASPYEGFTGGMFVAAAHGSVDSIVFGAGAGGGPHVRAFEPAGIFDPIPRGSFFAYHPAFTGGVTVAFHPSLGVVTGAGPGGGPHVRSFTENGIPGAINFLAY